MDKNDELMCPEEVKETVLCILYDAILSIRMAGWNGDAEYCALEADHIHNLPSLIMDYNKGRLRYYLEGERPGYLERLEKMQEDRVPTDERLWIPRHEQNWQRLEKHL